MAFNAKSLTFLAVVLGIALGMHGATAGMNWTIFNFFAALFRVLELFVPRPHVIVESGNPWSLRVAAVICGFSGFFAVITIWLHTVGKSLRSLFIQFFLRKHTLLYGSGPSLGHLIPAMRERSHAPVRVPAFLGPQPEILGHSAESIIESLRKAGLNRASLVVVDCGDDAVTLSAAKPILAYLRSTPKSAVRSISIAVSDPVISDQLFEIIRRNELDFAHRVVAYDASSAVARAALADNPLFPRAFARKQQQVHAMIVGFGALGERLLDQVMLTSLAAGLGVPRITVIDRHAFAARRSFAARRPAVLDQFDIEFFELDVGQDPLEGRDATDAIAKLAYREAEAPLTAIMVALGKQSEVMQAALLLDRTRQRSGTFLAPIWYRCRVPDEVDDVLEAKALPLSADRGFIRMSLKPTSLLDTILGHPVSEPLARRLHESYRLGGKVTSEADQSWDALPETYRRANIRAADHMPAKLWGLGIRVEGDLASWLPSKADMGILRRTISAPNDDPLLRELARIEHDRWMIDRRLDGWRYGVTRDNVRRIHPLLIPFAELSRQPNELEKDINQVRETLQFVINLGSRNS